MYCQRQASQVALVVKNLPAHARDIKDASSVPGLVRSPGGGHGNPLQYSCLENPMDKGAWQASQSWTWLKRLSRHAHMYILPRKCHRRKHWEEALTLDWVPWEDFSEEASSQLCYETWAGTWWECEVSRERDQPGQRLEAGGNLAWSRGLLLRGEGTSLAGAWQVGKTHRR